MTTEIKETISRASSGLLLAGPTKIRGWGRSSMTKLAFTGQALNGRSRQDLPAASDQNMSFGGRASNGSFRQNQPWPNTKPYGSSAPQNRSFDSE